MRILEFVNTNAFARSVSRCEGMSELPFNFGGPQTDVVAGDASWFIEDFDLPSRAFSFVKTDPETLAREPFLDYRWNRTRLLHQRLDQAALVGRFGLGLPRPQLHFIWHTSHCCSTLIAGTLDAPGRNLTLREPFALVPVADAKRVGAFERHVVSPRLPEIVFRLLARPHHDSGQITVKPSNFANYLLLDAIANTSGKMLFLYSDLTSFLISVCKGGLNFSRYARQLFANIAGDDGKELPWSATQLVRMSDLEIAAMAWHLQIAEFQRGWPALEPGRAASLDCDAFLADPATAIARLDAFFGFGLGRSHVEQVMTGPLLRQHAKSPMEVFNSQMRQQAQAAIWRERGADIERVVRWSYDTFPLTPRDAPLPNPLIPIRKIHCP